MIEQPAVYLDHAATTPMRPEAVAAMLPFLVETFGNPSGSHGSARRAKRALEEARETVALELGAAVGDVIFTSGGTEADYLAIVGAAHAARTATGIGGRSGAGIVTTAFEHQAVLGAVGRLEREGFRVTRAAVDRDGIVDLDSLAEALDAGTVLVSVMLVNNEVGTIQPLDEVAALLAVRAPNAVLHTDAVQAVPWIDVASAAADAQLVSISAHKFGGPKGVGVLVARDGIALEPQLAGGGQEQGRRPGTVNVAGVVAAAAAIEVTGQRRAEELTRVAALRDRLMRGLEASVTGCVFNGDPARQVAGTCSVEFPGVEAEVLLMALDRAGVQAAAGSSCASGALEPSHVLLAMDRTPAQVRSSIRLTLGHSSTDTDIDRALEVIPRVLESLS